ncbi:hypothetical protein KMI_07g11400 [Encephalitozoon hellem]|nr:uncharacterized protein EHEL_030295 [Encephalitozoon hellem ATCC 50504]AHL28914.1 hypothetical protein EHEL_030295 [Encephalitozoon hellem ATCC 50504]KAG5859298.1 hypothetical protein KMI_07g11400 [Encephalitozoon hellem]
MEHDSKLRSKAVEEYEKLPVIKKVPIVIYYYMEKSIERVPARIREAVSKGYSLLSAGHLMFCTAVPFIYVYQRDKNIVGDSLLSAEESL